jgi:hypothetical protein
MPLYYIFGTVCVLVLGRFLGEIMVRLGDCEADKDDDYIDN